LICNPRIVIVGAGPTGLGAALRLQELQHTNWQLIDAESSAGGLARSIVDDQGFTWDLGGHVLFSHYEYFDRWMDDLLGDQWLERQREAWIWMRERFIPYPLQNNIWRLPADDLIACLEGMVEAISAPARRPPRDFGQWIRQKFGEGLAQTFMLPYNRKVWAYDPAQMSVGWMGERVALVDLARVLRNLVLQRDDVSWGPNSRFRFPLRGGTGAIWQAAYGRLDPRRVRLGAQLMRVDPQRKVLYLRDGGELAYDCLVSTIPLDILLRSLLGQESLTRRADDFLYSSSHIVGIGLEGEPPESLRTKCWMYFPEGETPFYRATVFSNYSPHNVPRPGEQWSLMCEVSESPVRPVDQATIVQATIDGCVRARLLPPETPVVSRWHRRLHYGYPTPFLGRDELLGSIEPQLRELGIWSRGRFGGWKYEVANQDHSFMQGVEAVDHLLLGAEELTFFRPELVNSGRRVQEHRRAA
jgi:protoporphyrinogen oxidase